MLARLIKQVDGAVFVRRFSRAGPVQRAGIAGAAFYAKPEFLHSGCVEWLQGQEEPEIRAAELNGGMAVGGPLKMAVGRRDQGVESDSAQA